MLMSKKFISNEVNSLKPSRFQGIGYVIFRPTFVPHLSTYHEFNVRISQFQIRGVLYISSANFFLVHSPPHHLPPLCIRKNSSDPFFYLMITTFIFIFNYLLDRSRKHHDYLNHNYQRMYHRHHIYIFFIISASFPVIVLIYI